MQADVVAFLCDGRALGSNEPPTRRDTHGAILFLVGDRAWKLKRAVRFGYLDFSTPEKRHEALEAELRLNRRTAPTLYRAVHPINRDGEGRLSVDGDGAAVDWLLEMTRFPDDGLLADLAEQGALDSDLLTRLADRIASFHDDIAPTVVTDAARRFRSVIEGNVASMAAVAEILDPDQAHIVGERQLRLVQTLAQLLDARGRGGRVRHGHGDLHLGNIALIDGEPTLFDCLEFSEELATTDLLYDLAFLLMDLWHRGGCVEANIVFNCYMDVSAEDDAGLALLPLFLSTRATVRAHVAATRSVQAGRDIAQAADARAYLDLALALLQPVPPRLVAIGGLSGTGKSTVARLIGGHLGRAPGARILRSDVIRKHLAGVPLDATLPREAYTDTSRTTVYERTFAVAEATLACGHSVIVDAVLSEAPWRADLESVARRAGATFDGLWLEAPIETRITRVAGRQADASDADANVARAQGDIPIGDLSGWRRLSAVGTPEEICETIRKTLRL